MADAHGVAVTRAAEDCDTLVRALESRAVRAVVTPLLRYEMLDPSPLVRLIAASSSYDWLVCTSRHAVDQVAAACREAGVAPGDLAFGRVGAVGEGTADALRTAGFAVDSRPAVADASHLASAMLEWERAVRRRASTPPRAFFPRASGARDELPSMLRGAGWVVDDVPCYETHSCEDGARRLVELIERGEVGAVTLASGSACRAFAEHVPTSLWAATRLVSIGPTTSAVAREVGLDIAAQSPRPAMDAFADTAQRVLLDSLTHA